MEHGRHHAEDQDTQPLLALEEVCHPLNKLVLSTYCVLAQCTAQVTELKAAL